MLSMKFYSVRNNSNYKIGFPWAQSIVEGQYKGETCPVCKGTSWPIPGDMTVRLEPKKGVKWPDVLGCGSEPLLIFSGRALEAWEKEGGEALTFHRVEIARPLPKKITEEPPPYYWLEGKLMLGAQLDFEASGFVDVWFCPRCGRRTDDISATDRKQHSAVWPITFMPESWRGANLFTTDLSPYAFFCTEFLVDCARKHKLTNFRFIPVEMGYSYGNKGLKYM